MFGFGKKKQARDEAPAAPEQAAAPQRERVDVADRPAAGEASAGETSPTEETHAGGRPRLFSRLKQRLSRTRSNLGEGLGTLLREYQRIDDQFFEDLETLLLTADLGVEVSSRIVRDLGLRVARRELIVPQDVFEALKADLRATLTRNTAPVRQPAPGRPQVVLMVGVNGAGKTTTIGKLASRLQEDGNRVMLAAGDTFRAAAVEQLQAWGERNDVPVIAQHHGADPASVVYDALQAATARSFDVLIADTAGRLHTKSNLMDELAKMSRVLKKIDPDAPHEVMLVVDATTGQNALNQAQQFHSAVGLTGITLTKLDGTAKGGILFAIAERLDVPIRFVGVGEGIEDLRPFDPVEVVDALLTDEPALS